MAEIAEFEQMDAGGGAHARGEPSTSARDIARTAAAEAVRGDQNTSSPGTQFSRDSTVKPGGERAEGEALESEESQFSEFQDMDQEQETQDFQDTETQETQEFEAPEIESTPTITMEEYEQLQEMGVDIPLAPDEVPEEFQDAYAELTQSILDTHHAAQRTQLDAQEAIMGIQNFVENLRTPEGQQRLMLGIAMNSPETFESIANEVARMQEDPEYAEMVQKRLEAEVKLEAAERKERALQQSSVRQKGQQIEGRTVRQARRHGVDPEFAKEQVAQRILMNEARTGERDITLQEVDQVVQGLAKRMGKQRTKSPKTRQREKQAPTQSTQGAGKTPAPPEEGPRTAKQSQESGDPLQRLRGAIRESAARARSKGL